MQASNPIVQKTFERMREKLIKFVPEAELLLGAELVVEIEELKKERNAVILGHNYMEPALYHTVPDYVGDSLQLSRNAAETNADVIVFCGVEFMAETAKILSPNKTVLVPAQKAGCSLAQSITAGDVRKLKKMYPGAPVVSYVNTYADVKSETDVCCTSGNAAEVVKSLNSDNIIFIPDEYLASNVAAETGRNFHLVNKSDTEGAKVTNSLITWPGKCEVHDLFTVQDIKDIRKQFPNVDVLAHPECKNEVVKEADFSGSTSAMINHVKRSESSEYLLLTECAMGDNIVAENPEKNLLRLCSHRCPYMAKITLEMTRDALKYNQYQIEIAEDLRVKAEKSLFRMLEIG